MKTFTLGAALAASLILFGCEHPTSTSSQNPGQKETSAPATVLYDSNGADGGTAPTNQAAAPGQTVTLSTNGWTKTGHEFSQWQVTFSSGGSSNLSPGQTFIMPTSGTVAVKATWTKLSYSVSYDLNGGTTRAGYATTLWDTKSYPYDSEVSTSIAPTPPSGKSFTSWLVTFPDGSTSYKSQNGDLFKMPAGPVILKAQYVTTVMIDMPIKVFK